jgi:SDR family mycofactocin-dependent oxidoreductase
MGRMDGKVVLITGAARGQGRSHALTFAREGADVVLFDVAEQLDTVDYDLATADDLAATAAAVDELGRRAVVVRGDVRHQDALDAAVARGIDELGTIDVLVANAGIWTMDSFWELSEERWSLEVDVNLSGVWRAAKAVAPHMIERRRGAIVMTSSVLGFEALAGSAHYTAAKHGVLGLMRAVALELAPHDINVNAVCPGCIGTPMNHRQDVWDWVKGDARGSGTGTPEDFTEASRHFGVLAGRTALTSQPVSDAVLFLASDEAKEITGVALPVDAGHLVLQGYNPAPTR